MQTEIALSTTEAEYIALSHSMRDLIPLRGILQELAKVLRVSSKVPKTHSSVFEDNNGALELAREPKYRPRTKHIAIKYHHFREHVKNKTIKVLAIDTKEQIADIFTKPLKKASFEYLRYKLMGWLTKTIVMRGSFNTHYSKNMKMVLGYFISNFNIDFPLFSKG